MNTVKPKKSFRRMSDAERERIAQLYRQGLTVAEISAAVGREHSTVRDHLLRNHADIYTPGARGPKPGAWARNGDKCPRCGLLYRYSREINGRCYRCVLDERRRTR